TAIRLWDATTGKEIREFKGHPDIYSSIAFSRDGKLLAAGGVRGRIQLWDVATGKEPNLPPASDSLRSVAFTPDGEKLVSWGSRTGVPGDGEAIIFWNPSSGRELGRFSDYTAKVSSVALSPQGKIAAVGTWLDTKISLVDLATGKKLRELPDSHYGPMAFTSDGQILLTADYNPPVIHLWQVATGKELRQMRGHRGPVGGLALSPDGKTVASLSRDNRDDPTIRLWDFATGKELRRIEFAPFSVTSIAFLPDSKSLVSVGHREAPNVANGPGEVRLWDMASGKEIRRFEGHREPVYAVALSPDGRTLATGDGASSLRLWEVATAKERLQLPGNSGPIGVVTFSPDGRLLASSAGWSTALVWDVRSAALDKSRRTDVSSAERETRWADLAGNDAAKAYRSILRLVAAPRLVVPYLRNHLRPVDPADASRIARLIADLDSPQFAVRDKASRELEKLGDRAAPALRNALNEKTSIEVRRRVDQLLDKLTKEIPSGERLP